MNLSHLSETLIGSGIVKLGGEIREKIRQKALFHSSRSLYSKVVPLACMSNRP